MTICLETIIKQSMITNFTTEIQNYKITFVTYLLAKLRVCNSICDVQDLKKDKKKHYYKIMYSFKYI